MSQITFPERMSISGRTLPFWQSGLIVLPVFLALPAFRDRKLQEAGPAQIFAFLWLMG